jgi:hypothetical protein
MSVVIALTEHIGTLQVIGQHVALPTAIANPLDGIVPNFSFFGVQFDAWWKKLFAAVWAVLIVMSIFYLAVGFQEMAKSDDSNPHQHAAGKKKAKNAGIGLVGLAALGVIVSAILAVVG